MTLSCSRGSTLFCYFDRYIFYSVPSPEIIYTGQSIRFARCFSRHTAVLLFPSRYYFGQHFSDGTLRRTGAPIEIKRKFFVSAMLLV
jgi:hypothetical protein